MKNSDMPIAFVDENDAEFVRQCRPVRGLTKREYFAGLAMNRILAKDERGVMSPEITAQAAVRMADALLAELDKEPQP